METDEGCGNTGQETAGASSFWGLLAQFAWKYQNGHGAQSMDFGTRQPQLWSQPHHCPGKLLKCTLPQFPHQRRRNDSTDVESVQ